MVLATTDLLKVFTQEQINNSTYTTPRGATHIRLINNNNELSIVPPLYPNIPTYKKELNKYTNIKRNIREGTNGNYTGNRATDVDITPTDLLIPEQTND